MKLSAKGRYAVAAMMDLARHGGQESLVTMTEIAQRQSIPLPYLEQLFHKLKKAGLIQGYRGKAGGYRLARPSGAISLADITRAVSEDVRAQGCKGDGVNCRGQKAKVCDTHWLWVTMNQTISGFLEGMTLDDACTQAMMGQETEKKAVL